MVTRWPQLLIPPATITQIGATSGSVKPCSWLGTVELKVWAEPLTPAAEEEPSGNEDIGTVTICVIE
jgi:hypothetical protein